MAAHGGVHGHGYGHSKQHYSDFLLIGMMKRVVATRRLWRNGGGAPWSRHESEEGRGGRRGRGRGGGTGDNRVMREMRCDGRELALARHTREDNDAPLIT